MSHDRRCPQLVKRLGKLKTFENRSSTEYPSYQPYVQHEGDGIHNAVQYKVGNGLISFLLFHDSTFFIGLNVYACRQLSQVTRVLLPAADAAALLFFVFVIDASFE